MSLTLHDIYQTTRQTFKEAGLNEAEIDAKALITGLLNFSTIDIATKPDFELHEEQLSAIETAVKQRLAGKPVYRILGWREFYGLKFELSQETLEPRADTECLVEAMIPFARKMMAQNKDCHVLDLGTGTGAIALSLINEVKGLNATGADISHDALATASKNAEKLGLADRFETICSSWTANLDGKFDIVVSNPPYITSDGLKSLSIEVQDHDPSRALDGGQDGLDCYRALALEIPNILKKHGIVGLEIGFGQQDDVVGVFEANGFEHIETHADLGGIERALIFTMS